MLLPAMILLMANSVVNRHYHQISGGQIICHAHPFDNNTKGNTPYQSHDHSKAEYIILWLVSNILILLTGLIVTLLLILPLTEKIFNTDVYLSPVKEYYYINASRAPPFLS